MQHDSVVFLLDCDNTLLDNDRVQEDLRRHLIKDAGRRGAALDPAIVSKSPPADVTIERIGELAEFDLQEVP